MHGRSGVDDQLPRIGIILKIGTGDDPDDDRQQREAEHPGLFRQQWQRGSRRG